MADKRAWVFDLPSVVALLEVEDVPRREWSLFVDAAEFLLALSQGEVEYDDYPEELASGE